MQRSINYKKIFISVGEVSGDMYGAALARELYASFKGRVAIKGLGGEMMSRERVDVIFNSVMWRIRDCVKNSVSMHSQSYCSHKELQNKNGKEQREYTLEKTGEDWNEIDDRYKYGILVKKEIYLKPVDGGSMDYSQNEFVERSRTVVFSENLSTFSDESVQLIMRKYK